MRAVLSLVTFVVLLVSGCLSGANHKLGESPAPVSHQPVPPAAPATANAENGAIDGTIVDDEARPVAGAHVVLLRTDASTTSDDAGKFSFSNVVPGEYGMAAELVGYQPAGKKVSVEAGKVSAVRLTMPMIVVAGGGYNETFIFNGYIQVGETVLDIFTGSHPEGTNVGCQKCQLFFNTTDDVVEVVLQLQFTPTLTKPSGSNLLSFQLWSTHDGGNSLITNYATADWKNGDKLSFNHEKTMPGGKAPMPRRGDQYVMENFCETAWLCVDQHFNIYYTVFHGERADANFTAVPK